MTFDILHVLWHGEVGGAERAVYQLALHQHVKGPRTVALGYGQARGRWCEEARQAGIPVIDFSLSGGRDAIGTVRAARWLRRARIHHFHGLELPLMAVSAAHPGASRVYTHRAGATSYPPARMRTYRAAGAVIRPRFQVTGNTSHAVAAARKLFRLSPDRWVPTTYNGLDLSLLAPIRGRAAIREETGVPGDAVVIGTASNLRAWKRVDWLIEAATTMQAPDWRIWVLGDGPDRERLERLAAGTPVANRISFLGRKQAMGDWLRALDVFALPSGPEESFGNAAVEAMACSLPTLVAADSPGMVEHVEHGVTGLVVSDPQDLGRALDRLAADPGLRARLGRAAEAYVADRYTLQRAAERYEEVYRRVEDSGGGTGTVDERPLP